MNVREFDIDLVDVKSRLRDVSPEKIAALKASMAEIGLINPITLYSPDEQTLDLVAGLHRLTAARELGWTKIAAVVLDGNALHAQLAEIDENLCRANLTPTQEAEHSARRQEIWAAMEAAKLEVAQVEPPQDDKPREKGSHGGARPQTKGFAESTAAATGKSKASINRAIHRAEAVCQEARDLIRGTKLDTGTFLDRLAKAAVSPKEQVDRVHEALDQIADKENADELAREAAARKKAAKEDAYAACNEISAFLFEKLTAREWAGLIEKFERAGWTTQAKSLRNWEPPQSRAA